MADQHGQPTSGTGDIRKRKVSDDIDSTVAETKFLKTSKNPPNVAEDVTVLRNKDLPPEAESLDLDQLPIDILLLTVKDCEFLACLSFMTSFTKWYENDLGFVYIGSMCKSSDKMKIAVMKCKMGAAVPGGAAGVVRDAVKALTPKAVFCVGYCRGLNPAQVKLGDVVISEKLITYAPSKVTDNGIEELGDRVPPSTKLGKLILNAADGWKAPLQDPAELEVEIKRGALLSGPQVVEKNELRQALIKRFPNGIAIEMEGEGVYSAAHDLNVEWIIIKGVSEFADGEKTETNSWRLFASLMAASLVAHILKNPIIFENWSHYKDGKSSLLSSLDKGEAVLQPSRGHAPQTNDSKRPVSSEKVIKDGVPTRDDLQLLSMKLGTSWKPLARCLKFEDADITGFHKENEEYTEKALKMLQKWKAKYGSGATYRVLHEALCDERVCQRVLAERFCYC